MGVTIKGERYMIGAGVDHLSPLQGSVRTTPLTQGLKLRFYTWASIWRPFRLFCAVFSPITLAQKATIIKSISNI